MLESRVVLAIGGLLWLLLSWLLYIFGIRGHNADSAYVAEIFYNFKSQLVMTSSLAASINEASRTLWYRPAEFVCAQPLTFDNSGAPLTWHMYFIGYLLIPLARLLSPDVIIAGIDALIYVSIPLFAYVLARSLRVSILNSVLLAVLVVQHPLWQLGLFGQFYFNKLFLPLCALVIWLITRQRINVAAVWVAALLAASTAEIYGLILAPLIAGAVIMQRRHWRLLPLAALCGLFSIFGIWLTQVLGGSSITQDGVIASTVGGGLNSLIANRLAAFLVPGTRVFAAINGVELALLALGSAGHLALGLLLMLPNLFVSIGGAEKTGWATHYHVTYWVPLIWAAVLGAARFHRRSAIGLTAALVVLIGFSSVVNPATLEVGQPAFTPAIIFQKLVASSRSASSELAYRDALRAAIKPGETVTAPEPAMYNLFDHRVSYYPLNIDHADRVIFLFDQTGVGDQQFRTPNYGQQDDRLDACIVDRMKADGYDFEHPQLVGPWAIVGRQP